MTCQYVCLVFIAIAIGFLSATSANTGWSLVVSQLIVLFSILIANYIILGKKVKFGFYIILALLSIEFIIKPMTALTGMVSPSLGDHHNESVPIVHIVLLAIVVFWLSYVISGLLAQTEGKSIQEQIISKWSIEKANLIATLYLLIGFFSLLLYAQSAGGLNYYFQNFFYVRSEGVVSKLSIFRWLVQIGPLGSILLWTNWLLIMSMSLPS